MTMLIELDSDNRWSSRRLFDRYPYLHGSVAAAIEGGMGRVFVDSQEEPRVALAVLDFHFLAGDPLHADALLLFKLLQPGDVVIAPTPAWQHLVAATYPSALAVYPREAFQAEQFDIDKLRRFCQALPSGFELRQVRLEEVVQFATDLDHALIYNFRSHEEFITRGVGVGILNQAEAEQALAAAPNLAFAHHMRGTTLIFSGRPKEGIAALQRSIGLDPRHPKSAMRLNQMAVGLGI